MTSGNEAPHIHASFVKFLTLLHVNNHSGKLICDVNYTAFTEQADKGKLHNEFHPFFNPLLTKCHLGVQIKKNVIGGARGMYGMDRSGAYTVPLGGGGGGKKVKKKTGERLC